MCLNYSFKPLLQVLANNVRCSRLGIFFFLLSTVTFAQVGTNFDEPTAGSIPFVDPAPANLRFVDYDLSNSASPFMPTVVYDYAGGELGFSARFEATRANNMEALYDGTSGTPQGDYFGVYDNTTIRNLSSMGNWDQTFGNGYLFEDTDGRVVLRFSEVDLSGTTSPQFSMNYFLRPTSYEDNSSSSGPDYVYIRLEVNGGTTVIPLLDTRGIDIDGLSPSIEDAVLTLSQDLTAQIGNTVQLVVEVDFNATSERMVIDNINFTEGSVVSIATPEILVTNISQNNFGLVAAGQSVTQTYTIQNTGSATLTIADILSDNSPTFQVLNAPMTISAGASESFTLLFSPTLAGTQTAQITINSDASSSPTVTFPVSGRGIPEVSLVSSSPSLAENGNVGTFIFTFTASVPTATDLRVSFSVSGTATYNEDYYLVRGATRFDGNSGEIVILQGSTVATVVLQVQQDAVFEDDESIILTIATP
ncbi:MAG: choice-of-anchor D domain-containing protein [Bacteroidota bacterium]